MHAGSAVQFWLYATLCKGAHEHLQRLIQEMREIHDLEVTLYAAQLRALLSAQSRATEGFVFQGLDHIKDHAEITLSELTIAGPNPGQAVLKGEAWASCTRKLKEVLQWPGLCQGPCRGHPQ